MNTPLSDLFSDPMLFSATRPNQLLHEIDDEDRDAQSEYNERHCDHIAIVSCGEHETQCMDCLRIWPKEPGFKSDYPQHDVG